MRHSQPGTAGPTSLYSQPCPPLCVFSVCSVVSICLPCPDGMVLPSTALSSTAANVDNAAQWGKGMMSMAMPTHAGKGDVDVDVQCTDVCSDVCTPVPQKVCNDLPYQTQVRVGVIVTTGCECYRERVCRG